MRWVYIKRFNIHVILIPEVVWIWRNIIFTNHHHSINLISSSSSASLCSRLHKIQMVNSGKHSFFFDFITESNSKWAMEKSFIVLRLGSESYSITEIDCYYNMTWVCWDISWLSGHEQQQKLYYILWNFIEWIIQFNLSIGMWNM